MLELLQSIGGIIVSIFEFLIQSCTSLVNLITRLPKQLEWVNEFITVLPDWIFPFALISITIMVILFILEVVFP